MLIFFSSTGYTLTSLLTNDRLDIPIRSLFLPHTSTVTNNVTSALETTGNVACALGTAEIDTFSVDIAGTEIGKPGVLVLMGGFDPNSRGCLPRRGVGWKRSLHFLKSECGDASFALGTTHDPCWGWASICSGHVAPIREVLFIHASRVKMSAPVYLWFIVLEHEVRNSFGLKMSHECSD